MSIDKMVKEFKDLAELQLFAESQYKIIIQLSKKNAQLDEEVKHLKKLVEQTTPVIAQESSGNILLLKDSSDEEVICRVQLKLLKDIALDRELTLEECRKVEAYTKVLLSITSPKQKSQDQTSKMADHDLLALLETEVTNGSIK